MAYAEHESVVLLRDVPDKGLERGDLGVIVHVYREGGLEVEFVRPDGHTLAVVTLGPDDVRSVRPTDMIAIRETARS